MTLSRLMNVTDIKKNFIELKSFFAGVGQYIKDGKHKSGLQLKLIKLLNATVFINKKQDYKMFTKMKFKHILNFLIFVIFDFL